MRNLRTRRIHIEAPLRWLLPVVAVASIGALGRCAGRAEQELLYDLEPVSPRDIIVSVSAAGTVEPVQTVEVKSKASGEIIAVNVDVGDEVTRGQVLVRVDPRVPTNALVQAEADLEVAKAQLTNAEARLRRAEALYKSQSITEEEWENARLNHANANSQLVRSERAVEDARIAFEDTEVRAASPGVILSRQVEVGTVIQSASSGLSGGAILLTMANLDTVQVRTLVDETDIGLIEPDQRVTIRVDAYPNQPFEGRVLKVEPAALVEQNVTMFPVLIRLANEQGLMRPGMSSEVEISVGQRRGVLAVPNVALRTERDYESAAAVLGLDVEKVRSELDTPGGAPVPTEVGAPAPTPAASPTADTRKVLIGEREMNVPDDVDMTALRAALAKMEEAGGGREGMQALNDEERAIVFGVMRANGGRRGGGEAPAGSGRRTAPGEFAPPPSQVPSGIRPKEHIVFVLRNGEPYATRITTGLTDLDYSEVLSGLSASDTIVLLSSSGGGS